MKRVLGLLLTLCAVPAYADGVGGTAYPNPLQDVRVRQALWYAIDMDAIVDALWNNTVVAAHKSLVPEGSWQADGLTEYSYNPDLARKLLAEAGWDGSYTIQAVYYTGNLLDTITAIQLYENENVEVIPMFYIPSWIITSDKLDMAGNPVGNDQFAYRKNILDWNTTRDDHTLYTNTGAINFLEHPATNPALFWHQKVVFDRLLTADASLAPTDGQLAESFEVSEDGTVITFTLRDGVKWHDGEPFTAEDVKWTFEYYPTVPGANTVMTDVINDAKAITVDGNKVIFEFNNPQPNALTVFSQWPVLPKHCLENVTPENFSADIFWQNPIGTGPFKVDTVKLGEYTILTRNADYFLQGSGNIERMYLYPSSDAGDENLITNAMAGNIDYAFCKDSSQVQQLMGMDDYTVETVNVTFPRYIFLNMFER